MKDITVLGTACGAMFMPGFFECLKDNGERKIRIIGVDSAPIEYMNLIIDKFYQVPALGSPDYIETILDICLREKVDIVFPQISMELEKFAEAQDLFNRHGIKLAISNPNTLCIANNKLNLYKRIKDLGLPTPSFFEIKEERDYDIALSALGFPNKDVCIKIPDGSGQRGIRIVSQKAEPTEIFLHQKPSTLFISADGMRDIVSKMVHKTPLMAMECLKMPEYTVDLLADHGIVKYIGGRMNIESSMSIAQVSEVLKIQSAFDLCTEIVKQLDLNGNIGFDFMFDEYGIPMLTDLNPRITATIVLFKHAGINFPYLRIKQLLNEPLPECHLEDGVRLIRKYNDIILQR